MVYTVIINTRSYDLPKKTLNVVEKIDEIMKVDTVKGLSVRQKFEKLHDFTKAIMGEENAREAFGTDNLSEMDLAELTLAVRNIIDAYEKPISDYETQKAMKKFDAIPMKKIDSISKMVEMSAKAGNNV